MSDESERSVASAGYAEGHLMERRQQVTRLRKPESAPEVRGWADSPVSPLHAVSRWVMRRLARPSNRPERRTEGAKHLRRNLVSGKYTGA